MSSNTSGNSPPVATKVLSGWGNYPKVVCAVTRPERWAEVAAAVTGTTGERARIARGLGRSYGDPALTDL